jgi:hypothetical protein
MNSRIRNVKELDFRSLVVVFVIVVFVLGCSKEKITTQVAGAQSTYATPEEAGQALFAASQTNDETALAKILGPDSKAILTSGDPVEDKAALASFVTKYQRMNRWVAMTDGSRVLYIGADNYAFPIPMAQDKSSKWYFNTAAGKDEVLARRIGKNELLAIDTVLVMADAEKIYFKGTHDVNPAYQYAEKVVSDAGTKDGLYWEGSASDALSPLGRLIELNKNDLAANNHGDSTIFNGYSFRILTAQGEEAQGGAKSYIANRKMTGGFAILATPVTYGNSGIMSFILGRDGVVYQRNLGKNTADTAALIKTYNPDAGWIEAE